MLIKSIDCLIYAKICRTMNGYAFRYIKKLLHEKVDLTRVIRSNDLSRMIERLEIDYNIGKATFR